MKPFVFLGALICILSIGECGYLDRILRKLGPTDLDDLLLEYEKKQLVPMEATFYSREEVRNNLPASGVRGSTLKEAMRGYGLLQVSVDPRKIPLFTRFNIKLWDSGDSVPAIALDVGGSIKENLIDIYVDTINEAINLGRRKIFVEFKN